MKLQTLGIGMFSTEPQALARSIQYRVEVRYISCLPVGTSHPARGAQGAGGVVVHLPEPSPQSQAGFSLASLWPGWALLILALQQVAKEDMGPGTGRATAFLPFCRQSLLDVYSCTE